MNTRDVADHVTEIAKNFEEMKKDLKKQHEEMATKGHVDALLTEKLQRINEAITKAEEAKDAAEKAQAMTQALRHAANEFEEKAKDGLVKRTDPAVKAAINKFIRKGEEALDAKEMQLLQTHTKSLSSGADPSGGYVVSPEMDSQITRIIYETSPMRQLCEVKQISTDQFERLQRVDLPSSGWADRDASDSAAPNTTMNWKKMSVKAFKQWAEPAISQDLIDDAFVDVEAELSMALAQAFELTENSAFVTGNGVGQPMGILSYAAGSWNSSTPNVPVWGTIEQIHSGNASALTYAGIVNLVYALKDGYLPRASFLANRLTVAQMRLIVDGIGRPMWEPGMNGEPATFMGFKIYRASDMPVVASNALSLAFGDFSRAYLICDRIGTRILRDPYTSKPFVKFYTTKRVGGSVMNFEALKIQKIAV